MKKGFLFCICVLVCYTFILNPINVYAEANSMDEETVAEEFDVFQDDETVSPRSVPGGEEPEDETWYDLPLDDEDNPILPNAVDYTSMPELLTYLKPGDLVYERNGTIVGDVLHHIAIVVGVVYDENLNQEYVLLLEAVSYGVKYGVMTPTRFQSKEAIILRLTDATDEQKLNAIEWAKCELDKKYVIDVTKNSSHSNPNWYCSELVWAAYYAQGIYLDLDDNLPINGSVVLPDEIYQYENAATILHSDYQTTVTAHNEIYHTYSCNGEVYNEPHEYEYFDCCYEKCTVCGYKNQIASHDYTYRYIYHDPLEHSSLCECGAKKYDTHSFVLIDGMNVCSECGYSISAEHEHVYSYVPKSIGRTHYKTCSCGIKDLEACTGAAIVGEPCYCGKCGQLMLSTGGLLPLGKDDEEEEEA